MLKKIQFHTIFIATIILTLFFIFRFSFQQSGMYLTHDGEIHIIRSLHFYEELSRGQFPVRVVPDMAYSYGYSVFNFFYPLPYYSAFIFQLMGFSTTLSWKLIQVIVTFFSFLIMYAWMRKHLDKYPALFSTVLYTMVPFRFLTLYVTGQIGGYFALLFAPMIGLGLYNLLSSDKNNTKGLIFTIGIAGMITSHLLSVIIFFLALSIYTLWLLKNNLVKRKIISLFFWLTLGVGLSSFYFLPFMLEKKWIRLGNKILVDYSQHWPTLKQLMYSPWGYGGSNIGPIDDMSFQIGFALLLILVTSLILIFFKKQKITLMSILTITFIILLFLMTRTSQLIWNILKPLQLIQFPWRLLAATSLVGSFLAGLVAQQVKGKQRLFFILLILSIAFYNVRNYTRPWTLNWRQDINYQENLNAFYGPTDISWELMPITATTVPTKTPEFILNATNEAISINQIIIPKNGNIRKTIYVTLDMPLKLNLALWDLPVWTINVDKKTINKEVAPDGTIIVPVDKGKHTIEIILEKTKLQKTSDFITLFSILLIITIIVFPKLKIYVKNTNQKNKVKNIQ